MDKVDFVSALARSVLLAYLLLALRGGWKMWFLLPYLLVGIVLTFYSFSTTGILGLTGAILSIAVLFKTRSLRTKVAFIALCFIGVVAISVIHTHISVLGHLTQVAQNTPNPYAL